MRSPKGVACCDSRRLERAYNLLGTVAGWGLPAEVATGRRRWRASPRRQRRWWRLGRCGLRGGCRRLRRGCRGLDWLDRLPFSRLWVGVILRGAATLRGLVCALRRLRRHSAAVRLYLEVQVGARDLELLYREHLHGVLHIHRPDVQRVVLAVD